MKTLAQTLGVLVGLGIVWLCYTMGFYDRDIRPARENLRDPYDTDFQGL